MKLIINKGDSVEVHNHREHLATITELFVEVHYPATRDELKTISLLADQYELLISMQ
jgi:hypothetical protein